MIEDSTIADAGRGRAAVAADFDDDGAADLFIVNDNLPDQLYLNNLPYGQNCWQ